MYDPLTVLIVEDEPLIAMAMQDAFEGLGYACWTASTVEDGLAALASVTPRFALLDTMLRDVTSKNVANELRARGTGFIVCSGLPDADLPPAYEGGVLLRKPYTMETLTQAVAKVLAKSWSPPSAPPCEEATSDK